MILRIAVETATPEQAELVRDINEHWPMALTVTIHGIKFTTADYRVE